jgi:hypothetical protein
MCVPPVRPCNPAPRGIRLRSHLSIELRLQLNHQRQETPHYVLAGAKRFGVKVIEDLEL